MYITTKMMACVCSVAVLRTTWEHWFASISEPLFQSPFNLIASDCSFAKSVIHATPTIVRIRYYLHSRFGSSLGCVDCCRCICWYVAVCCWLDMTLLSDSSILEALVAGFKSSWLATEFLACWLLVFGESRLDCWALFGWRFLASGKWNCVASFAFRLFGTCSNDTKLASTPFNSIRASSQQNRHTQQNIARLTSTFDWPLRLQLGSRDEERAFVFCRMTQFLLALLGENIFVLLLLSYFSSMCKFGCVQMLKSSIRVLNKRLLIDAKTKLN